MKLTKRRRQLLELMADGEELVQEGLNAWIGDERTSSRFVKFCLWNMLVHEDSELNAKCHYYTLNEWGHRVLKEKDFEPWDELASLKAKAEFQAEVDCKQAQWRA